VIGTQFGDLSSWARACTDRPDGPLPEILNGLRNGPQSFPGFPFSLSTHILNHPNLSGAVPKSYLNTFKPEERTRQHAAYDRIKNLPLYTGPVDHTITVDEIQTCIKRLKFGKASGLDMLSTDILKVAEEPLARLFVILFNQSLSSGSPPKDWGAAAVAVIYKSGDRADCELPPHFAALGRWETFRVCSEPTPDGYFRQELFNKPSPDWGPR
jgi:hypothetical protein